MKLASAVVLVCLSFARIDAYACVPIRYDESRVNAAGVANELVAEAHSVELMRAASRRLLSDVDPLILETYGPLYEFTFEVVEVVHGRRGHPFNIVAFDRDEQRGREFPLGQSPPSVWFSTRGYERLQESFEPDPAASRNFACGAGLIIARGELYLVFRDSSGALLTPGLVRSTRPALPARRPVFERIAGDDLWLSEVRRASEAAPQRSALRNLFDLLFANHR